jgi:2-polyprenyl-6-hydroxyphenyl methylase/3-demethylubiquinone-9 3-methyltransferase
VATDHGLSSTPASDPLSWVRGVLQWNVSASKTFDRLFPLWCSVDGNMDYQRSLVHTMLAPGQHIVDVGGGKLPVLSAERKHALGIHVTGLDISSAELARAPRGAYDHIVCADITHYAGDGTADVVLCQGVLEHVRDVESALKSIVSLLKPGGVALLFVPSRNAVFARLNLLLPEALKRWLLYTIYPHMRYGCGFVSYYDRCTPADFERLAREAGAPVEECRYYYMSAYLTWCAPLHILWRCWVMLFRSVAGRQAAETFSCTLRKL